MIDMQNKIEWLKYLLNLDHFKEFYSRIDKIRIHRNKPYKSYFGINLKDSRLVNCVMNTSINNKKDAMDIFVFECLK